MRAGDKKRDGGREREGKRDGGREHFGEQMPNDHASVSTICQHMHLKHRSVLSLSLSLSLSLAHSISFCLCLLVSYVLTRSDLISTTQHNTSASLFFFSVDVGQTPLGSLPSTESIPRIKIKITQTTITARQTFPMNLSSLCLFPQMHWLRFSRKSENKK